MHSEKDAVRRENIRAQIAAAVDVDTLTTYERIVHARQRTQELLHQSLYRQRRAGLKVARTYAWFLDNVLRKLFSTVAKDRPDERIALLATGGYGRAEMAPASDLDIMFLVDHTTDTTQYIIETFLRLLWDMNFKVGYATRTPQECATLIKEDIVIKTSLLERRFLAGNQAFYENTFQNLYPVLFDNAHQDFVIAKLEERDVRHQKWQDSRYVLEPNIKEAKGGLRDLQTLFWIVRYIYQVHSISELVEVNFITHTEAATFRIALEYLWTVRCALHFETGRATDVLTMDHQVTLAEKFGYHDRHGQRAVERFMKHYFLIAKEVGDLTGIFCATLEHMHKKPSLSARTLTRINRIRKNALFDTTDFKVFDSRIGLSRPDGFSIRPLNLLHVFELSLDSKLFIHPATLRKITQNLKTLDSLRTSDEANQIFLRILTHKDNPVATLRYMNETGVLGRFLPNFGYIVGMMQFNMYHSFTVDEHTLQAINQYYNLYKGAYAVELAHPTRICGTGLNHRLMCLALLYHDIGKGRPQDHSVLGMHLAKEDAPRFSLSESESKTLAWLVEHHLLMSDTAQKRDLSDPDTIRIFAETIKTTERLKMLYILTVCDIRAVGPTTWNNWKGVLLEQLYDATLDVLTLGHSSLNRRAQLEEAQATLRHYLRDWDQADVETFINNQYPHYWLAHTVETQAQHADILHRLTHDDPLHVRVQQLETHDSTQVCICTQDHTGLFARIAGALAVSGVNVIEARTFTTRNGLALTTFWIQDIDGTPYQDTYRIERLKLKIKRTLKGDIMPRTALQPARKRQSVQQALFDIPASVSFENNESDFYTIIEVNGQDRPGLLYELSRSLSENNIKIFSAVIATYGEHAVDVFYVKDLFGMKVTQPERQEHIRKRLLECFVIDFV